MKDKNYIFGERADDRRPADSETTIGEAQGGMIRNTVAMAGDVNTYGYMTDEQVYTITKEIVNALVGQGVAIDPNTNNQLLTMIRTKLSGGYSLTGVYFDGVNQPTATLTNSTTITFSSFKVYFNKKGFFGNTQSDLTVVNFTAPTVTIDNTWAEGAHFLYATPSGTIEHSTDPISAAHMASRCMLGSVFVLNKSDTKTFQTGSFKYQPWLMSTDHRTREVPVAETKGGYISAASASTLQMGALEIVDEGINFDTTPALPSVLDVPGETPYTFKILYPGYNANAAEVTALDTLHIYNITAGRYEPVKESAIGKFMVFVPCVTPTKQTLLIAPMTEEIGGKYTQVYDTQEAAEAAIFGLHYSVDNTRKRCIYLGQSLIIRIGENIDLSDNENFKSVGMIPQELAGFTSSAGQAGGSAGQFIPMPEVLKAGTDVLLSNFCSNVIQGSSKASTVTVRMPPRTPSRMNELMAKYTHVRASDGESLGNGLTFDNTVRWWVKPPVFVEGNTYLFTFDYIEGYWYGDYSVYSNL